jgi:hypothetical protein
MKPSQVAFILRRIATTIEASRKPQARMVIADIQQVVSQIEQIAAPAVSSGEKIYIFKLDEGDVQIVRVSQDEDSVWQDTMQYLEDAGLKFSVEEAHVLTPGELSDTHAPRDD